MPWTPKIGFGNDLKCSFVSLYISEFIAITYLPRSFALPAFSREMLHLRNVQSHLNYYIYII